MRVKNEENWANQRIVVSGCRTLKEDSISIGKMILLLSNKPSFTIDAGRQRDRIEGGQHPITHLHHTNRYFVSIV
jgi:hypothetical protein